MKTLLLSLAMAFSALAAHADPITVVTYGRWTYIPYCGGMVRLQCADVDDAKNRDQCYIQFSGMYACHQANLYVGNDFYPTYVTSTVNVYSSSQLWVDHQKLSLANTFWSGLKPAFNVYLTSGPGNATYSKLQFQFDY